MPCKMFGAISMPPFFFFWSINSCSLCHLVPCIRRILCLWYLVITMDHYQVAMQEAEMRKGPWLEEEDERLIAAVSILGERRWDSLAKASGLRRSGRSCRLRWMNYLRPNLKHGHITEEEEHLIVQLHKQWGNRWSRIARSLPGRTDNEIKNYWRTHLRKKALILEEESSASNSRQSVTTTASTAATTNNSEQNSPLGICEAFSSLHSNNGDWDSEKDDYNLRTCGDLSGEVEKLSSLG
ncbi:uncharacterized protein [Coffea arabica]|uniref:Uncharacterized protein n=1 Tax=Coffea arabica TaxID=13443 RepID=A0A6P6SUC7_COFAR